MRTAGLGCLGVLLLVGSCAPVGPDEAVAPTKPIDDAALTVPDASAGSSSPAHGKGPAGIVLYCRHQGEVHLLLANDRFGKRGWGGFVGGNKEGENSAMTAARETHEETRGYYDQMKLYRKIAEQSPTKLWGCHWYFAEVPHVPAQRIMDHSIPLFRPAFMETQHYAWVPYSEIEPLLTKRSLKAADLKLNPRHLRANTRSDSFWRVWADNMRQLHLKDAFPWKR